MPFPAGWPPGRSTNTRPIRFQASGVTTAAFQDNAWLFATDALGAVAQSANLDPLPSVPAGSTAPAVLPASPVGGSAMAGLVPRRWAGTIRIRNDSLWRTDVLAFSFDGVNVHGLVQGGEEAVYRQRTESGICVQTASGNPSNFRIEAW